MLTKDDVESGDEVTVVVEPGDGERVRYDGAVSGTSRRKIRVEVDQGAVDLLEIGVDGKGRPGGVTRWRHGQQKHTGDVVEFRHLD